MCGRFALKAPPADIISRFGVDAVPEAAPRYNIAPTQPILIVRHRWQQPGAGREAVHVKWGLLPSWAKDASMAAMRSHLGDYEAHEGALKRIAGNRAPQRTR